MKNLSYKIVFKYLFVAMGFCLCSTVISGIPFSLALFSALLSYAFSPFLLALLFSLCNLLFFNVAQCLALAVSAIFLAAVSYLYKRAKRLIGFEIFLYLCLSVLPYIFGNFDGELAQKLIYSAIIVILSRIFTVALKVIIVNTLLKKSAPYETVCLAFFTVFISTGFINATCIEAWQIIALTASLLLCGFYKNSRALIPAIIFSISICAYHFSLIPLALFVIYCAVVLMFISTSRLLSVVSLVITQVSYLFISGSIATFNAYQLIMTFLPACIFLFLPSKLLQAMQNAILKYEEPVIAREIINDERAVLSSKLYNLSSVFSNIEANILATKKFEIEIDTLTNKLADEIIIEACSTCALRRECIRKNKPEKDDLIKLINIGIAKGKVCLIDLSKDISSYCLSSNSLIYATNKLICEYNEKINKNAQAKKERDLLSAQSGGIAQILKTLAYEFSQKATFKTKREKLLFDSLCQAGIIATRIVYIDNQCEYHLLFKNCEADLSLVAKIISKNCGENMHLVRKIQVRGGVLATYAKKPALDACFGICTRTKENSCACGDSHSLTRIDGGSFLVALCDGMGSGQSAMENSQTAISLVESLAKSKMSASSLLNFTNKMLSLCEDDSFSTLDMAIIDLYSGFAQIIKLGAPFGFIISSDSINLIESSSLPMGVLDNIDTVTMPAKLKDGDILLMLSDGVTDAFFSSSDIIDYLATNKTTNPQTLADNIVSRAIQLSCGVKDDMTALAVKIFTSNNCA